MRTYGPIETRRFAVWVGLSFLSLGGLAFAGDGAQTISSLEIESGYRVAGELKETFLVVGKVSHWPVVLPEALGGVIRDDGRLEARAEGAHPGLASLVRVGLERPPSAVAPDRVDAAAWREAFLRFGENPGRREGAVESAGSWWLWGRRAELPWERVLNRAKSLDYAPLSWTLSGDDLGAFAAVQRVVDSGAVTLEEQAEEREFGRVGQTVAVELTEFREETRAGIGVTGYAASGEVSLAGLLAFDLRSDRKVSVPDVFPESLDLPVDGRDSGRFLSEDAGLPFTLSLRLAEEIHRKTGKPVVMVGSLLREAALWGAWSGNTVAIETAWRRLVELGREDTVVEVDGVLVVRPAYWGWHRANRLPVEATVRLIREWAAGEDLSHGPVVRFVERAGTLGQGSAYLQRWRQMYQREGRLTGTRQWVDGTVLALLGRRDDAVWEAAIRNELQGMRTGDEAELRRFGRAWRHWRALEKGFERRPTVRIRVVVREGETLGLMTEEQWAEVREQNPLFAPLRVERLEGEEAVLTVRGRVSLEGARVLLRLGG